jgi:hypothetical protein
MNLEKVKGYRPCEICGYDIHTQKHHPHGRQTVFLVRVQNKFYRIQENELKQYASGIWQADVYIFPLAKITVCNNCHGQFSAGLTLSEVIKNQKEMRIRLNMPDLLVNQHEHIRKHGNGYAFNFDKSELEEITGELPCGIEYVNLMTNLKEYVSSEDRHNAYNRAMGLV